MNCKLGAGRRRTPIGRRILAEMRQVEPKSRPFIIKFDPAAGPWLIAGRSRSRRGINWPLALGPEKATFSAKAFFRPLRTGGHALRPASPIDDE